MLYELIAIVRPNVQGSVREVKEIARSAGSIVLNGGGVVRGYTNWGTFLLSNPIRKKSQPLYREGHHFIMRFDSSSRTQHILRRTMSLDPRLLRYSVVKLGSKLEDICDVPGKAEWNGTAKSM